MRLGIDLIQLHYVYLLINNTELNYGYFKYIYTNTSVEDFENYFNDFRNQK